jgi:hypothetical protein
LDCFVKDEGNEVELGSKEEAIVNRWCVRRVLEVWSNWCRSEDRKRKCLSLLCLGRRQNRQKHIGESIHTNGLEIGNESLKVLWQKDSDYFLFSSTVRLVSLWEKGNKMWQLQFPNTFISLLENSDSSRLEEEEVLKLNSRVQIVILLSWI